MRLLIVYGLLGWKKKSQLSPLQNLFTPCPSDNETCVLFLAETNNRKYKQENMYRNDIKTQRKFNKVL